MRTSVLEQLPFGPKELVPERLSDLPEATQEVNCSVGTRLSGCLLARMSPARLWSVGTWLRSVSVF